jgi:hypothetical protein
MRTLITVSANQITMSAPDDRGAKVMTIAPVAKLYHGRFPRLAAEALRAYPVGASVHVRHAGGQRSCMNKPDLWAWVESLPEVDCVCCVGSSDPAATHDPANGPYMDFAE